VTGPNAIHGHISGAESLVRAALENWDAGDLDGCSHCGQDLHSAIREMEAAQAALGSQRLVAASDTVLRVRRIQEDIDRLSRMVDAAEAFARGLARFAVEPASDLSTVHEG
jgi:hypothetical protein